MSANSKTTDLVARLRRPEQWRSFPDMDDDAPREAADEIERLQDRVAYLERCFRTGKRPV